MTERDQAIRTAPPGGRLRHPRERVALVTGAARGLGFAERLAQDGCRVLLADVIDCADTLGLVVAAGCSGRALHLHARRGLAPACCNAA